MGVFWLLVAAALLVTVGFAAHADWKARRDGQVLVPVKTSRFGRTSFVRMDREDLDLQKASAILAERERQKAEGERKNGMLGSPDRLIKGATRSLIPGARLLMRNRR